jgi:tetratricopeptide (TPR) repeat protein
MPGTRDNTIVMRGDLGVEAREIIQHEYAHFILHNHGGATYPRWYDEGFAKMLSTVRTNDDAVLLGVPSPQVLAMLQASAWIPMTKLIETRSLTDMNLRQVWQFYGESWALVHYLFLGRDRREGELAEYLALLDAGTSSQAAFERAFGIKTEQLDAEVNRYVRSEIQSFEWPDRDFSRSVAPYARPLPLEEIATDLGIITLRRRTGPADAGRAEQYLRAAIAANAGHARAYAALGDALLAQDKVDEADGYYRKAIEIAPRDPLSELDYGEYLAARASRAKSREERHRWLDEARKHFVRAWKIDPHAPESYAEYGASFIADGEDHAKGLDTLEHAAELLPSSFSIRLSLADLYLQLDRAEEARVLLTSIVVWLHPDAPERKQVLEKIALAEKAARAASGRPKKSTP